MPSAKSTSRHRRGRKRSLREKRRAKKVRNVLVGAGAVLAVAAAYAFFLWQSPASGGEPSAACVLVIDRTESVDTEPELERNRRLVRSTVDGCRTRSARLDAYVFRQDGPKADLVGTYQLFPPRGRSGSKQGKAVEEEAERAVEDLAAVFDEDTGSQRGSDILTALATAADNLRTGPSLQDIEERYLVALTDGIQISTDISLASLDSPDDTIDPLLDTAAENGLIPPLEGVSVTFVGPRGGSATGGETLPDWFEARIEQFWREIVTRGGGDFCSFVADVPELPVACS